jgi:hypothetical protein
MASTDTRSGFRLPWSSDRSHDQQPADPSADEPAAIDDGSDVTAEDENVVWPESDLNARLGLTSQPRPVEASDTTPTTDTETKRPEPEEATMLDQEAVTATVRPAPKKPSKLMADLSAAIRATAETAREQALAQVDADVTQVVEAIRSGSKEGEETLRAKSDEDIAGIKEWSREEVARIKSETESKIADRRAQLTAELEAHAGAIEARVGEVEGMADDYRSAIAAYASRLQDEDDPSMLATMAESMPEAPSLEALADLGNLAWSVPEPEVIEEPEAVYEPEPQAEAVEAVADVVEPEAIEGTAAPVDAVEAETDAAEAVAGVAEEQQADAEANGETVEAVGQAVEAVESEAEAIDPAATWDGTGETGEDTTQPPADSAWGEPAAGGPWGEEGASWRTDAVATAVADDDTPRWADGETPDGFPAAEGGDPVDRGAIMAALEAAAEAVVAAESAAESAGQAEAAADVAETAAELLKDRVHADEVDPEAAAAMAARVDAGGVEESYTDRLAKLLPAHGDAAGGSEPRTTAVVVSGLVSVASIASFKRHLGRISGVQSVTVASGPDGEFVFNVNHLPDVSFRDAVPTMPGFAARVTGSADGTVHVTARDPEAEG